MQVWQRPARQEVIDSPRAGSCADAQPQQQRQAAAWAQPPHCPAHSHLTPAQRQLRQASYHTNCGSPATIPTPQAKIPRVPPPAPDSRPRGSCSTRPPTRDGWPGSCDTQITAAPHDLSTASTLQRRQRQARQCKAYEWRADTLMTVARLEHRRDSAMQHMQI